MSVPYALSSAVAYGFGDFAGGLAARKSPVLRVTAVAQVAGQAAQLVGAVHVPREQDEPPRVRVAQERALVRAQRQPLDAQDGRAMNRCACRRVCRR